MDKRIGVLGGGQLGRMLAASASLLNLDVRILDVGTQAPAKQVYASDKHIDGSFSDPSKIHQLAQSVDILTVEIEHVNAAVLEEIERTTNVQVHPSSSTIRIIQDKFIQKDHLRKHKLPVADYVALDSSSNTSSKTESLKLAASKFGLPLMLKARTLAYDGRGNFALHRLEQAKEAFAALGDRPLYVEKWAPFVKEVAVMVVRNVRGDVRSYPAVETVHKDNICHLVFAPLRGSADVGERARRIAEQAVQSFTGAGIFGVELFLMPDGELLINEIAPRPHNSGHYTIEACHTSQYENHLRAILDLPLGSTALKVPSSIMLNLIGASSNLSEITTISNTALTVPGATVHLYGKAECRKGRKMGHITIVGDSDATTRARLRPLLQSLPGETPESIDAYIPPSPPSGGHSHPQPLVGIIMGSDSDLPVMLAGAHILDAFKIPYELTIVSAHRTPERMVKYAQEAAGRGIRVIIAGAGGAAHLPGMVAALTSLPVVGVPVKGSTLDGVDSLHSIVQMPRGIPVATVAINNATNAGLLAARIIGSATDSTQRDMDAYLAKLETEVMGKVEKLEEVGWDNYTVKR